jgi:hypothetical protein
MSGKKFKHELSEQAFWRGWSTELKWVELRILSKQGARYPLVRIRPIFAKPARQGLLIGRQQIQMLTEQLKVPGVRHLCRLT